MTSWTILFAVACLFTAVAGAIDVRTGLIPNRLTLTLLGLGVPAHVLVLYASTPRVSPWLWAADAIGGVVICSLVPLLLWRTGGMGGGDLKLFAALGAWLGVRAGLEVQLVAFAVAALGAPALLAYRGRLWAFLRNLGRQLINPLLPKHRRQQPPQELLTELRFGPVIFAGTLLVACVRL